MAQIAANNVGEKRFEELCDEMGVEVVLEAIVFFSSLSIFGIVLILLFVMN